MKSADLTLMFIGEQNQRTGDITSSVKTHDFCLDISTLRLKQSLQATICTLATTLIMRVVAHTIIGSGSCLAQANDMVRKQIMWPSVVSRIDKKVSSELQDVTNLSWSWGRVWVQ